MVASRCRWPDSFSPPGSGIPVPVPALISYLKEYPQNRPEGLEDFFYWTVVISVSSRPSGSTT
jgi:hypothetical protein